MVDFIYFYQKQKTEHLNASVSLSFNFTCCVIKGFEIIVFHLLFSSGIRGSDSEEGEKTDHLLFSQSIAANSMTYTFCSVLESVYSALFLCSLSTTSGSNPEFSLIGSSGRHAVDPRTDQEEEGRRSAER